MSTCTSPTRAPEAPEPDELPAEQPTTLRSWEDLARCRDLPTGLFFSDDLDEIAVAKQHCLDCPVRSTCLEAAVERREQFGIWGGHLFVAGRIVLHKRRRGRPPKVPRPGDTLPEVEVPVALRHLVTA